MATRHPGERIFSEIEIPSYQLLLETIDRAHKKVPILELLDGTFLSIKKKPVLLNTMEHQVLTK